MLPKRALLYFSSLLYHKRQGRRRRQGRGRRFAPEAASITLAFVNHYLPCLYYQDAHSIATNTLTLTLLGKVVDAAKVEAAALFPKLASPGNLTYKELATGVVCGVQVFGAFCVGEIVGRNNVVGYDI
jgi:hypothetical protein